MRSPNFVSDSFVSTTIILTKSYITLGDLWCSALRVTLWPWDSRKRIQSDALTLKLYIFFTHSSFLETALVKYFHDVLCDQSASMLNKNSPFLAFYGLLKSLWCLSILGSFVFRSCSIKGNFLTWPNNSKCHDLTPFMLLQSAYHLPKRYGDSGQVMNKPGNFWRLKASRVE